jgi:hypothetical protein
MKEQLHEGHALDIPRLDMMNAGDVEEVIFVIVGDLPFHLLGTHAAVGLSDVDRDRMPQGKLNGVHGETRRGALFTRTAVHAENLGIFNVPWLFWRLANAVKSSMNRN